MVKTSWAGQLVVQGMVCPACIEHVDNSILSFIERVMARGLIFLGSRGNKILPMIFDAVQRGINLGNDFAWCKETTQRRSPFKLMDSPGS